MECGEGDGDVHREMGRREGCKEVKCIVHGHRDCWWQSWDKNWLSMPI